MDGHRYHRSISHFTILFNIEVSLVLCQHFRRGTLQSLYCAVGADPWDSIEGPTASLIGLMIASLIASFTTSLTTSLKQPLSQSIWTSIVCDKQSILHLTKFAEIISKEIKSITNCFAYHWFLNENVTSH